MSDGEYFAWHILALIGAAVCLGVLLEHWSHKRRQLPPPDSRALRSRCEY